jgi:DNA-binding GntR family transcriptional regulator
MVGDEVSEPTAYSLGFDPSLNPTRYMYELVADHIADRIKQGCFQSNTRLPGERDLAHEYGVALGTVRHATKLLHLSGLVVPVPSKGTYVTVDAPSILARREDAPDGER